MRTAVPALGFVLAFAVGGSLLPAGPAAGEVSVGWVQGGAPGGGVTGLGQARTITRNQADQTRRLAAQVAARQVAAPDFVVWPENSTDLDPSTDLPTAQLVEASIRAIDRPLLAGTILDGPGPDQRRTAAQWIDPDDGVRDTYIKRSIVPFGEWIPYRDVLLPLVPQLQYVGAQAVAGAQPGLLLGNIRDGREIRVGILLCFDLAFDNVVYDLGRADSQILIAQSSNAMYQGSGQIDQQFAITRARAAEMRREILVVTTSGVSGLIDPRGTVIFKEGRAGAASGVVSMPLRAGTTPAVSLAPLLEALLTLVAVIGTLVAARGRVDGPDRLAGFLTHPQHALGTPRPRWTETAGFARRWDRSGP